MASEDQSIKVWDVGRRTVEAFDKNILEIRRIFITLAGVLATVMGYIIVNYAGASGQLVTLMHLFGVLFVSLSVVFWGLDQRYQDYLKISSSLCEMYEKEGPMRQLSISRELREFRYGSKDDMKLRYRVLHWIRAAFPHFIYFMTGFGAIIALLVIDRGIALLSSSLLWYFISMVSILILGLVYIIGCNLSLRRYLSKMSIPSQDES